MAWQAAAIAAVTLFSGMAASTAKRRLAEKNLMLEREQTESAKLAAEVRSITDQYLLLNEHNERQSYNLALWSGGMMDATQSDSFAALQMGEERDLMNNIYAVKFNELTDKMQLTYQYQDAHNNAEGIFKEAKFDAMNSVINSAKSYMMLSGGSGGGSVTSAGSGAKSTG